jgi:DNA-binding response OmpR family regulator
MKQRKAGGRILVVEDELTVAMCIEDILVQAGYVVVGPVGRLEKALEAVSNEQLDVALLDMNLKGKSIYPVARILADRGIPFAFLSGYGADVLPADIKAPLLPKPFDVNELLATLDTLLV